MNNERKYRELANALIWDPEKTKKISARETLDRHAPHIRLICLPCEEQAQLKHGLPRSVSDMMEFELTAERHTEGVVWIGKCLGCKTIYYALSKDPSHKKNEEEG